MRVKALSLLVLLAVACSGALLAQAGRPAARPALAGLKIASMTVEPAECPLVGKWAAAKLRVTGFLADKSAHDLTPGAQYRVDNPRIATVTQGGVVRPLSDGEASVIVTAVTAGGLMTGKVHLSVTKSANASVSFPGDVMPLLTRLGCNAASCHGGTGGKGGLILSLFGAYPREDWAALARSAAGRRINSVEPRESLLLLKAGGALPHPGARDLKPGAVEYDILASWVSAGGPWGEDQGPQLASLDVTPAQAIAQKGDGAQLRVAVVYDDGTRKDVTLGAQLVSSNKKVAEVRPDGSVDAHGYGEAVVTVSYMRRSVTARVIVPRPCPKPFPVMPANNRIDELVLAKLEQMGLPPSELCTDEVFLRRAYLTVIGILPTADEAKAFLADKDPKKRAKLIDRLLDRDEYADYQALRWGDILRIKSEYPSNLWPNAVQAYYRWVRHSLAVNKPYDQFVREMLVSSGSNFRVAPANFYRALRKRDAQGYAESAALVFMGARLECARCHAHPTESWTLDDNLGMAAFFCQVKLKGTKEWKEEIVYVDPKEVMKRPVTNEVVPPMPLGGAVVAVPEGEDPRAKFAEWLTAPENPWFARNIVNRVWYWLFGCGIINEVDDIRPSNPPTNPELLAWLEQEFVKSRYDLKQLYRLILNSRTWQLSSVPNEWNVDDQTHFARFRPRRLGAEQLLDAIGRVTETFEKFSSQIPEPYTVMPDGYRATQLEDGSIGTPFLELFGRPPRDTAYESDRDDETTMRQALHLINSSHIGDKISKSPRIARLIAEKKSDDEVIDEIYLSALSRYPTDAERRKVTAYLAKDSKNRAQAVQDIVWAVLNTKEFLSVH